VLKIEQAIVLAGGEGQRLRPFTSLRPKVMLPIANKPILQYVIEALAQAGLRRIVLVVGYCREEIQDYFGSGKNFDVAINYVVQKTQIGTADALKQARDITAARFLVLPGDNIIEADTILPLVSTPDNTIMVKYRENVSQYGAVMVKKGKVTHIVEKPEIAISYLVNTGIYTLDQEIFSFMEQENDLPQVIQAMVEQGHSFNALETKATWLDAVYPVDILRLNEAMVSRLSASTGGMVEAGVTIKGEVAIGAGTKIRANSYLLGSVVIGENCNIGPTVCVFPATSIGNNVTISPFSQIRNSVIGNDVVIGSNCNIQDSIIAPGCVIGNGFTVRSRETVVENEKKEHVARLGALLGDFCELEDNIVVNSGISLGVKVRVRSMKVIDQDIPEGSLVF
jgi:UDP-N-acetylglucosamine diphosphorylase/glucosamine-1-phosphate N-acetyltransferase